MSQIAINEMSYCYKKFYEPVFSNVTVHIDTDWKLGLIGRNGRGKTTLLKLINGDLKPDHGIIYKDVLTQVFQSEETNQEYKYPLTLDVMKEMIGQLRSMEEQLEDMDILQRYLDNDGFEMEARIKKEFYYMKLPEKLLSQNYESLSGGEKTKIQLITLFLKKESFILLDEPTNHLDIEGKRAVAEYLNKKKGFIVVSHDRDFLDRVIDHVVSINKSDITVMKGNYTEWKENKDRKELYESRTKENLEREIDELNNRAVVARDWGASANLQKNPFANHARCNGSIKYMRQAKNSEAAAKEDIEKKKNLLQNFEQAKPLQINQDKPIKTCLVRANHLTFGYQDRLLIKDFSIEIHEGDRIWIKGQNGAGKSTLVKLLTKQISNDAVTWSTGVLVSTAYQEPLWEQGRVVDLFRTQKGYDDESLERFQILCRSFDLPKSFLSRPLESYSSGERKKADIARAMSLKHQILILDEPLNYMDIYFREQLEESILKYKPTLIFIEHDIRFGERVATSIINL